MVACYLARPHQLSHASIYDHTGHTQRTVRMAVPADGDIVSTTLAKGDIWEALETWEVLADLVRAKRQHGRAWLVDVGSNVG